MGKGMFNKLSRRESGSTISNSNAVLIVAGILMIVGCGQKSDLEKVILQGIVTYDDKPVANGEILFYPIEGTRGSVAGGPIRDGKYIAKGRGGVPVGKHRVEIRAFRPPQRTLGGEEAVEGGAAEQYLPLQYNAYSELRCEVDASTATKDFHLTLK